MAAGAVWPRRRRTRTFPGSVRRRIHPTARLMPAPVEGDVSVPITAPVAAARNPPDWSGAVSRADMAPASVSGPSLLLTRIPPAAGDQGVAATNSKTRERGQTPRGTRSAASGTRSPNLVGPHTEPVPRTICLFIKPLPTAGGAPPGSLQARRRLPKIALEQSECDRSNCPEGRAYCGVSSPGLDCSAPSGRRPPRRVVTLRAAAAHASPRLCSRSRETRNRGAGMRTAAAMSPR